MFACAISPPNDTGRLNWRITPPDNTGQQRRTMAQQQLQDTAGFPSMPFANYQLDEAYDEMFSAADAPRPQYEALYHRLLELQPNELKQRQQTADLGFLN